MISVIFKKPQKPKNSEVFLQKNLVLVIVFEFIA